MRNNKKIKIAIYSSVIIIILLLITYITIISKQITIVLKGKNNITLNINEKYQEEGYSAKICNRLKCRDITKEVSIDNKINNTKIGIYSITYSIKYKNKKYTKKRTVKIIDNIPPTIEIIGEATKTICPNSIYHEEGYKAIDNYDGDITDKVTREENNDRINYTIKDSSNNSNKVERIIVKKDDSKPIITLKGNNKITINIGQEYNEKGATAQDDCDGDISNKIEISNDVNTSKEGTYTAFYKVTDSSGNVATINRTVIVKPPPQPKPTPSLPTPVVSSNKAVYQKELENYIKSNNYNVSIGYINLTTGYTYLYRNSVIYYGASLVKTVDALYIYEKELFNDETINNVKQAITISDNTAHKNLVDFIGIENLRVYGRNLGAVNFLTRSNADYYGNTTVNDQIAIWRHLYNFINTNPRGAELKNYFINSYYNFLLFDGIPTTMHKYGYYGDYYHDVGIINTNQPYLVVILTKHGNNNFENVTRDLSSRIYRLNQIDMEG